MAAASADLSDHGEDGALDRAQHRAVRGRGRIAQRFGDHGAVGGRLGLQRVANPRQDLAEDHPGVAPGTHQGAVADRRAQLVHGQGLAPTVDLGDHRVERPAHVRAGVAVGHRVDVQGVDRGGMCHEGVAEGRDDLPQVGGVETVEGRHRIAW